MSPRQFGKVDISVTWGCKACGFKHAPTEMCVTPGEWLVLTLCPMCNPTTQLYCRTHRDRHMPAAPIRQVPDVPEHDALQRAAGETKEDLE